MYASRAICSRCSSQLRSGPAKRLGAAALYSTMADAPDLGRPAPAAAPNIGNEPGGPRAGPRQQRKTFKRHHNRVQDQAMALFNDVVSPVVNASDNQGTTTSVAVLSELEVVAKLKEITEKGLALEDQYSIFQTEIWPSIQELRGQVPKPIYMAATQLLRDVRDHMIHEEQHQNNVDIAQKYQALGKNDLSIRNDLVLNICARTALRKNSTAHRTQLKNGLVDMWRHISQLKRPGEVDQTLRLAMPSVAEVMKDAESTRVPDPNESQSFGKRPVARALCSIFLQFPPPQARDILPGLLASLAVISDRRHSGPGYRAQMAPLLLLVRSLLSKYELTEGDIHTIFSYPSTFPPERLARLKAYVVKQWPYVVTLLTDEDAAWLKDLEAAENPAAASLVSISKFHKQLRTAYQGRNHGGIAAIWWSLKSNLEQHPGLKQQLIEDPEFLDYWMFVWCATRRPNKIQEALELRRSLGIEPTVKTYTAMMHGWKVCKDIGMIEALWEQLVESGMKLDIVIWTERISALIELGRPQKGIQALTELVRAWKKAVKSGSEAQAVKPGIEAINAAFKGMLRLDPKAAHELLSWAGKEGFEPNVRTYNILLRETLRSGNPDDAGPLLRAMQEQGVDPDAATFTIILEVVIGRMSHASAKEQVAAVHQVFGDIEEAGVKANLETYGKMLYAVAGLSNSSDEAIAAVQKHMRDKGFTITPHMVTILIERVLLRHPPNINAVRSLLKENNLTSVGQGDQTLWERVMSANATAGDTAEALRIFDDLSRAGRPVTSLPCLTVLMQALLDRKELDSARKVVGVVLAHKLGSKNMAESGERYWKHHFWYLAEKNGLMANHSIHAEEH
ncbi:hypothetical protein ACJ41O_000452 [Fusarium nematophilum]